MQSLMSFANKVATGTLFDAAPVSDDERRRAILKQYEAYRAKSFPAVRDAGPKEVGEALARGGDHAPVLVDCRPRGEQVSSVPGSIREEDLEKVLKAQDEKHAQEQGQGQEPRQEQGQGEQDEALAPGEIILYCTVGYRSGVKAAKLQKEHPERKISNLRGGILLWAHDVGNVVDVDGKNTKTVHVFGKPWDLLPESWTSVIGDPDNLTVLSKPVETKSAESKASEDESSAGASTQAEEAAKTV